MKGGKLNHGYIRPRLHSSGFPVTPSMNSDVPTGELTSLIDELNALGRDLVAGEIEGDHFST